MDDETARRRESVEFAIASVRLSGFVLDDFALDQFERYIAGKITSEQMRANGLARYDKSKKYPAADLS